MAEEAGTATTTETTVDTAVDTGVDTTVNTTATQPAESTQETVAEVPFGINDIEWQEELGFNEETKSQLFERYSKLFKGKDEINSYLKELATANKTNKENQAKKFQELEAGWENSLKTDSVYGKDYDGNNKRVRELMGKFWSEEQISELDKFGFTKSASFKRGLLNIANEFSEAKVVGVGQPNNTQASKMPVDRWGNTMFDFTKKQ